mmetsp:Transcript_3663/g.10835  ORF Transcript_3663/g.10835 Transcript_3663/m.10835 type:complete len:323 (+) Transcript_3663:64-1032(+)
MLYPPIEPHMSGFMRTKDGKHELYYEVSGNPHGKPALFLHGGPGAGTVPMHRQLFDPKIYRIVLVDQRGAGKSIPNASLEANNTWSIVQDLEQLREHVGGVDAWHTIYGGSWGSTLALAYAQSHPDRVRSMVLRGIFLFGVQDRNWLFQDKEGAGSFFPAEFEKYASYIPHGERGDLLGAYHRRLVSSDEEEAMRAAASFVSWELVISRLAVPTPAEVESEVANPKFVLPFARTEAHFFVHGGWFEREDQLLHDCERIKHIPVHIVHGRYDCVCRPHMAYQLHQRLPLSNLELTEASGHSGFEANTLLATVKALDGFGAQQL